MPQIDSSALLQLLLLLTALPAQYLLTQYFSNTQHQTEKAIKELITNAKKLSTDLFSVQAWKKWCNEIFNKFDSVYTVSSTGERWTERKPVSDTAGENPALEVMRRESSKGYHGNMPVRRTPRPNNVQFRVGQVVKHKKLGYRAVIIGWDPKARASAEFFAKNHPVGKEHWREQPNYVLLVDSRDRPDPMTQITYVPQENIEPAKKTRITHAAIDDYFDAFDGTQYIPRPALRSLYPDD